MAGGLLDLSKDLLGESRILSTEGVSFVVSEYVNVNWSPSYAVSFESTGLDSSRTTHSSLIQIRSFQPIPFGRTTHA